MCAPVGQGYSFFSSSERSRAGLIQGREEIEEIWCVPESVVDMQLFGAHCMHMPCCTVKKDQWVVVKTA